MVFTKKNLPEWIILLFDLGVVALAVTLAFLLRFNFNIPVHELDAIPLSTGIILSIRLLAFIIGRTSAGILRYTSTEDAIRIFLANLAGSVIFGLANIIAYYQFSHAFLVPFSIIIIEFIVSTFGMIAYRLLVKITYLELSGTSQQRREVIIYGAGEAGVLAKRALDRDAGTKYKVAAYIDDNQRKAGKKLEGVSIYHSNQLDELLENHAIAHVIIAIQILDPERRKNIIEVCLNHQTKVLNVPPAGRWINGELSFKQIKQVKIEDLLGRKVINLSEKGIIEELTGKRVLVTGASGSIGSEIARQLSRYPLEQLILIDQGESPLYDLEMESGHDLPREQYAFILCDIRNRDRIEQVFKKYQPDIIYHAAAYKHVPMLENYPLEAIDANVCGSRNLADMALKYDVAKFIMVSTDKAVNPTNVLGASKRVAEIYTQSLNGIGKTRFITTRFGNVLGSNGSVIPLFKKQLDNGGPLTITHPEITRFFMTIPEACQLVLEAGAMGRGGEIFIFDMGQSVKIVDLAKKMIKLSGLTLHKDIEIKFTGLRPGEKLFEELLADRESTLPTHHPQIMIAQVRPYDNATITTQVNQLMKMSRGQDEIAAVQLMKQIVPEYKSKNSRFESLDA